jgi:recombination protein RecR
MRYQSSNKKTCSICSNPERDPRLLAVVATDTDVMALERSHTYRGKYFVIGGTVSLASEKVHNLRIRELVDALGTRIENNLSEIILAFPANPEGDATETIVREALDPFRENLTITSLGRGLSTGSELEYADPTTLKNALDNRR